MKTNEGFSLLELLIVVAIILIIATIAIPSLLRSRQAANETSAAANLRTLNTAQVSYSSSHSGVYGAMTDLVNAGLMDNRFNGMVTGYLYNVTISANALDYTIDATAASTNSGRYDYYSVPDYVIRYSVATSRPRGSVGPTRSIAAVSFQSGAAVSIVALPGHLPPGLPSFTLLP